ncbi:spermidine synthase [Anaeromyxobacter oryzisoli]|uniref:spermidine synthase n=1 Tax=Anaeromyxobacter oryzisoli TaxID=2925408 RepID=UPI001F59331B|nr:fused MFS/spermidine synthase [Anaeromyxobacter sp. SG63]
MRARLLRRSVYLAFGASGAAALVFEVTWTRTLSTVMGSSTYALSTMLAAFMAGLSVGGMVGALVAERTRRLVVTFALCELGIGVLGFAINPIIRSLTPLYVTTYYSFHESFVGFSVVQFAIAFLVMGAPTTLMGMSFPVVVKLFAERRGAAGVGRDAGRLYAVNTLGGIAGSLSAGFLLIPLVGVGRAAGVAATVDVLNAVVLLWLGAGAARAAAAGVAGIGAAFLATQIRPPAVPTFGYAYGRRFESAALARQVSSAADGAEVLFHDEGIEGDVWLLRSGPPGHRETTLLNGGKLEAGDDVSFALLGQLPYFTARLSGPVRSVLSIGLGSGRTLRRLVELPVESVESVELSRGVLEANRRFLSPELFSDARVSHVVADGRNHLLVEKHPYDVIVVSPSWATDVASAGLLTDEFFSLAARHLTPTGAIGVWVDFTMMDDADMSRLLRTFAKSFRHVTAWRVPSGDVVLVGASSGQYADERHVEQLALGATPRARGALAVALSDARPKPSALDDLNTDDHPVIEFANARSFVTGRAMAPAEAGLVDSGAR